MSAVHAPPAPLAGILLYLVAITLVVAATALRKLRMPKALGIPFRRGEAQ